MNRPVNPQAVSRRRARILAGGGPVRAGKGAPSPALAHYPSSETVSRLRPFVRRRFSTMRPFFVAIRTRNPCVLLRRRVLG